MFNEVLQDDCLKNKEINKNRETRKQGVLFVFFFGLVYLNQIGGSGTMYVLNIL